MKKITSLFLLLVFLLAACTPAIPAASGEPTDESVPLSTDSSVTEQKLPESNEEVPQDQNVSPSNLETLMQTSVLAVKWNVKTRHNEITPIETASAKVPPGVQPVMVGEEFVHAFSSNGQTLAIVTPRTGTMWDSVLYLVDVPTWTVKETSLSFTKWADKLVFSPDGKNLLIVQWPRSGNDKPAAFATLTLVDVPSQTIVAETDFPYHPRIVAFAKQGLAVYAVPISVDGFDGLVEAQAFLLNLKDFSVSWQASLTGVMEGGETQIEGEDYIHTFLVPGVAISGDGRFIYAVHANENKLTTVDFDSRQFRTVEITPKLSWLDRLIALTAGVAQAKMSDGNFKEAALSPDGKDLYLVGRVDETFKDDTGEWQQSSSPFGLQMIDTASGTETARVDSDAVGIKGFSADGTRLYVYMMGFDEVAVVDTTTLEKVKALDGHNLIPAQTLNGTSITLSSRTSSNGKTVMTILNPITLETMAEWVEPARAYFLEGQIHQSAPEPAKNSNETFDTCLVTLPTASLFTPPDPYPPTAPYAGEFWYGTEALWTALPTDGKWAQLAYGEKVFWWRNGFVGSDEPQPELSVSAKRLDIEAPIVEFGPPATNAYHADFNWAMLIGVQLPSSGCWEITGHYGEQALTFVVWVGD